MSQPVLTPRLARRLLAASLVAYGLTWLPGPWVPRFSVDALNYGFTGIAAISVPVTLLLLGVAVSGAWRKGLAFALAALVALPLVPYGALALLEAGHATAAYKPLDALQVGGSTYRLYRTDCGATCAYGLALHREVELLHVIKFVSPQWSVYREDSAALRLSPEGRVQVVKGDFVMFTVGREYWFGPAN